MPGRCRAPATPIVSGRIRNLYYKQPGIAPETKPPVLDCQGQIGEKGHMNARDILSRDTTPLSQKPRLGENFAWQVLDWKKPAANDCRVREKSEIKVRLASGKLFAGQYFDQETGFYYNHFRTYDPATGRYLESDPIGLNGGLNTYLYVKGNPLRFVDPLGLCSCEYSGKTYPQGTPDFEPWFWETYDGTMKCSYKCKDDDGNDFNISVTITKHRGWFDDPNTTFVCPYVNVYYEDIPEAPWVRQAWDTWSFDPRKSSNPDMKSQGDEKCKSCSK